MTYFNQIDIKDIYTKDYTIKIVCYLQIMSDIIIFDVTCSTTTVEDTYIECS